MNFVELLKSEDARAAWADGFIAGFSLANGHYEQYDKRADDYWQARQANRPTQRRKG